MTDPGNGGPDSGSEDSAKNGVRLRAHDAEDLSMLSSLCQDLITQRPSMRYDAPAKRFVLLGNRFCWERDLKKRRWFQPRPAPMRTRCALRFDYVEAVQFKGPFSADDDTPLNLLTISIERVTGAANDGAPKLLLAFSQGAALSLECEVLEATLDDLSPPWQVKSRPQHD